MLLSLVGWDSSVAAQPLEFWQILVLVVVGGGSAGAAGGGLIVWLVKKLTNHLVAENKRLTELAFDHIKDTHAALQATSVAIEKAGSAIDRRAAVQEERDRTIFKALDRIERKL